MPFADLQQFCGCSSRQGDRLDCGGMRGVVVHASKDRGCSATNRGAAVYYLGATSTPSTIIGDNQTSWGYLGGAFGDAS